MKLPKTSAIMKALVLTVLGVVLAVVLIGLVFIGRGMVPDIVRYDKPLSYADAIKEAPIDFLLPPSSRNIYYGCFAEWQIFTQIVRFEAPPEDCLKHIDAVIAWNDNMHHGNSSYPRVKVTHVEPVGASSLNPAPWFDPEKITRGIYVGKDASWEPNIWVDLDRGVFYFKAVD